MDDLAEQFEALNIHEERQLDDLECEFQDIGSRLMHQREARPGTKENATRFKCHFGISARVAARTWQHLLRYQSPLPTGLRKCHLLWAAHFLKEYPKVRSQSCSQSRDHTSSVKKRANGKHNVQLILSDIYTYLHCI